MAGGLDEKVTPFAGISLLIELMRHYDLSALCNRVLPAKKSPKGLTAGQMVECFVALSALGGECVDDFAVLRNDSGLATLLEYLPPAPPTVRDFLARFHDEKLLALRPEQGEFVPPESAGLLGLGRVNRRVVHSYVAGLKPGAEVTLDVDAHLVETAKQEALVCYEGYRAYQPLLVQWAETKLVLADQFRDGNVRPAHGIQELTDRAYDALPPGEWKVRIRSDSAAYEHDMLDHWNGRTWEFAVSADVSKQLRAEIGKLPESDWHFWAREADGKVREWAEVAYVPSRNPESKKAPVYRYVAVRVRPAQQGILLDDGGDSKEVRHFAVVTNRWDLDGQALLQWHRGKAGTIEHVHRVLVDELAAGVYPSGKFGVDAAWLRLQVLTYNLLELLKAGVLPEELRHARPKRLRFVVFSQFGRVVSHARVLLLRVATRFFERLVRPAERRRRLLPLPSG